ncbi:DUF2280 domain-containing protein [uncultured Comamonas sp.]|uniref:DUF2280 domain-containing protein n=1 Tax=uncultured Comamonas sp. TaxID=114710 RepID=UPI0026015DFF|nr:DUF2280 domain-containing protein [uncultured Comamonas sp.]
MATLTEDQKVFIVQALACYDSPSTVAAAVKDQFGVIVSRQQVESYDHTKASSNGVAKKLVALFDETRERFLEGVAAVPVAKQVYRLRVLQRALERSEKQGNSAMVLQILEQAAKELGGVYTNRKELTGKDGQPLAMTSTNVTTNVTPEQLKEAVQSVRDRF